MKVFTTGVYGWDVWDSVRAIRDTEPGIFVDVRRRRGLRGATYAWANSTRLQATLAAAEVPYVHRLDSRPLRPRGASWARMRLPMGSATGIESS